jgi:hypothetical protein
VGENSNDKLLYVEAGVPDGTSFMQILSPGDTEIECVVSFPTVSESDIVTVNAVSTPLSINVYVLLLPAPGAISKITFNPNIDPEEDTIVSAYASDS